MANESMMIDQSKSQEQDKQAADHSRIIDNMYTIIPPNMEKAWRFSEDSGKIPASARKEDKAQYGKFKRKYTACIFPVRINPNKPWDTVVDGKFTNLKRCDHILPKELKGQELQAEAIVHCGENHMEWFFETHSSTDEDGDRIPPLNTFVKAPVWGEEGVNVHSTPRDRAILRRKNARLNDLKTSEDKTAIKEATEEHYNLPKRGRPSKED